MASLFATNYRYTGREDKYKYVWLKYKPILQGHSILDVGADECHLKNYITDNTTYWGIGLGGNPDQQVNLEIDKIPFADNNYDTVLCLDVLEHIENPHEIFDELCRVANKYVVISLPNAWSSMMRDIRNQKQSMKYYGLPVEHPGDRHKWFLSYDEAEAFVRGRAKVNDMMVLQIDDYNGMSGNPLTKWARIFAEFMLFRNNPLIQNFYKGMLWAVLEKKNV